MAQRKKRVTVRKRKSTVRGRARKSSRSVRGKAAKRTSATLKPKKSAKAKRPETRKLAWKKAKPKPPITPVVETTTVDLVDEPAPAVTEFEETDIREADAAGTLNLFAAFEVLPFSRQFATARTMLWQRPSQR